MPDRIVRAGILTSDPVNLLSWAGEVFYRRLFSVVDDFGRYDARPSILRSHLYPLKVDRVSDSDVGKWLTECVNAGLVRAYQVSERPYLEVLKFEQRIRSEKSKWPTPADTGCQPLTPAPVFVDVFVVEDDKSSRKRVLPPDGVSDVVWQDFLKVRRAKRAPITDTAMDGIRREVTKAGIPLEAALRICCERGWQSFKAEWMDAKAAPGVTVPTPANAGAALEKIKADADKAAPMPAGVREQIEGLTKHLKVGQKGAH